MLTKIKTRWLSPNINRRLTNILFVLYYDFGTNSAIHVHNIANNLVINGLDCVVAVPENKDSIKEIGGNLYKIAEFREIGNLKQLFNNSRGPDIVHAWTPREIVRQYCEELRSKYRFKQIIHMEDNEDFILKKALGDHNYQMNEVYHVQLSHPVKYREFLASADGITVIIDSLRNLVPNQAPMHLLMPGVDTSIFFPREPDELMAKSLGIPINSTVICYTGGVHKANAEEVRSLYLAVALLNQQGYNTFLIRTGYDGCEFLGNDELWIKKYSIELGRVAYREIPRILSLANILVQPGCPNEFNNYRLPSKLPEFLAMGKPVILPATNLANYLTHKENAYILDNADEIQISNAVKELLQDNELYHRLSIGSYEFAKLHLNWQENCQELQKFYESVMSVK